MSWSLIPVGIALLMVLGAATASDIGNSVEDLREFTVKLWRQLR